MEPLCSNGSSKRILRSNSVTKQVQCRNQTKHSDNGASFIKLLGLDFSKELQIPREFVTVFNGCVPHRFILESGVIKECWRVEVEEDDDGEIYLREGWAEFVEAHPLEVGNYLLFEYEEQSIFLVKIYNRDGCQKVVPGARGCKNNPLKIIDHDEQEDGEASESQPKIVGKSPSRQEQTENLFTGGNGINNRKHATPKKHARRWVNNIKHATPRKHARTATSSLTEHNATFSVTIDKHMTYQFRQLTVPKAISLARLGNKKGVTLENAIGNRWPVKLSHIKDGRVAFTRGWKEFLGDNGIAPGDSLRFEFITNDVLKVHVTKASQIERKSEEAKSPNAATRAQPNIDCETDEFDAHTTNVNSAKASSTIKRSRKRCSPEISNSSFSFLWGPTTPGDYLHVPKVVTEGQKLMTKDKVVLRDPEGKCWPVETTTRRDGRVALTKGWGEFWKGHAIRAGDSLDFDFISEYIIQVMIHRGKPLEPPKIIEGNINLCTANINEHRTEPETVMTQAETVMTGPEPVAQLV
ncbi:hypothetical protein RND81_08G028900 [Saponaria officinalis]|uniref:TF-B3 domain-containing protein n=1 Tax=Saponaria officinalis TaxID=3572 RepID=A0AAW1J1V4_SAPOF